MYIQRDIMLQNREQIRKYNDLKKILLAWKIMEKEMSVLVFCVGPTKKMIKWVKNMPNFRGFLFIRSKYMWTPHL